jgi:hypothetical protein
MAKDSRTYGFSLTDAESLAWLIGGRAEIIPGRQTAGGGGGSSVFAFKASSTIGTTSGTASIYAVDNMSFSGTTIATGAQLRASALFGSLATNTIGYCVRSGENYIVIQAGCPAEEEYI